ncbi:MAG TPA: hypothetical protein VK421_15585 [Pyrinomonadaceae bacterium]|nr:hypothetical protein [Pyrinomonadaceae bacterium]
MTRRLLGVLGCAALVCASANFVAAQETKTTTTTTTQTTKTIQHADGSYTVIEYPADREVTVELAPAHAVHGARGVAKVLRRGDVTTINLDLASLPNTVGNFNVFALDPAGKFTLLGPVTATNGAATHTFTTPLDKFMLVVSPEANLTTLAENTPVFFRSTAPEGLAVIPVRQTGDESMQAVGEEVAAGTATTATAVTPAGNVTTTTAASYNVPMLGVPSFERGEDTMVKVNLAGEMTGSRVNFVIEPRKDGPVTIKARFHELKEAPAGKRYVLWAVSPDQKFTRVGQIINTGNRNEAEIRGEVAMRDFGLLITTEDATESPMPKGAVVGTVYFEPRK